MLGFSRKKSADNGPRRRDIARSRQEKLSEFSSDSYAFRRSQTLTGSVSSTIRSPGETTAHLKSPRVHAHALTRLRRHLGLALIGSLVICGLLFVIVSQFTATVAITINNDASVSPKANYAAAIEQYFANNPLERLRFLMNNKTFTAALESRYPEIASANIDGSAGFGAAQVNIVTRQPVAEWTVNGANEYVDASGSAFGTNYFSDPTVKIIDNSGVHLKPGQTLVSDAFLGFVGRVVGAAKQLEGLTVTAITIPPDTTRQIEVTVAGVLYPAKLSTDRPAGEQVEDMARTIAWLKQNKTTPHYIDVRVSGEAYYQ